MYCDTLLVLKDGKAVAAGAPAEVLTPELIALVYEVDASVTVDEATARPLIRFQPRTARPVASVAE
jgi:iron complex transport system ATP-binding protein